jgi:hypothetical protein
MGFTFDPILFSGLVPSGSSGGDAHWKAPVANAAALPLVSNSTGDVRITLDTGNIWEWNGAAWFLPAVPYNEKGVANGVATLDGGGHVPLSQLPASLVEYKGTWDASTNTPTLTNGVGVSGWFYIVSTGGTVNFGAGPITFYSGDWVLYNGSVWQRADNFTGYANQFLSNLGSPTAVNQDLNMTSNNIKGLNQIFNASRKVIDTTNSITVDTSGVTSIDWSNRYLVDGSGSRPIDWNNRQLQNGSNGTELLWNGGGVQITNNPLNLTSHKIINVTDPTGAQDAATKNYVDTNAANTTLSNLVSPTAVNQDLNMTSHNINGLNQIFNASRKVIDTTNSLTVDTSGVTSIDWSNRYLVDGGGSRPIDWNNRQLQNSSNGTELLWNSGGVQITNNSLNLTSHKIINVTDPTNPQDAATKNYVDNSTATNNKELFVLSGTNITNQYIDLAHVAKTNSINFVVQGEGTQIEGALYDYSVSYTGGAGGNTRITFLNGLAIGGTSALIAGDVVAAQYQY